jgi:hypothetical protein
MKKENMVRRNSELIICLHKFAEEAAKYQCCGSMAFCCGSGSGFRSADPCLWLMDADLNSDPDADPDPAIFVIDLQDARKKLIFL